MHCECVWGRGISDHWDDPSQAVHIQDSSEVTADFEQIFCPLS